MGRKVFAASSGSYSDYSVQAIFSTRERAEEYIRCVRDDWNSVEEYELDPPTAGLLKKGYAPWTIVMRRDGTVEHCDRQESNGYSVAPYAYLWERTKAPAYQGQEGVEDALSWHGLAKSEKQAVKAANEKRAQMIASGEWR